MTIELSGVLDPRVRRYVLPVRVLWHSCGKDVSVERLLQPDQTPIVIEYKADAGEPPAILLDFGRELHGGIQIENGITPVQAPVKVKVGFGESASEAMGEPNQDHTIHKQDVLIPWYGNTEIGNTGFRFVRIELVEPGQRLDLKWVKAVFVIRDVEYKGSFNSNDERLNTIWNTGAYTVHLCMQELLWDGIKRDRLAWIGDMHPETMVISSVFGEHEVVPKSLDFVRDQTPLPGWMNGISSYSMWWILIQQSWYAYHGNYDYLDQQGKYLVELLKHLRSHIGADNKEALTGTRFLDWPSSEDPTAIHAGLQSLMAMSMLAGADLCHTLGFGEEQIECQAAANRLLAHTPEPTASKQGNALMVLAGLSDAKKTNDTVLGVNPLQGVSTFYGYYVLQARAEAGDYEGCLEVIRKYWGGMLDVGATTFWEDFDLSWREGSGRIDELPKKSEKDIHADYGNYCYKGLRHSLCHGWAAGPVAWLSEHVLGFKPLEPGCRSLLIKPHLGDLKQAEGTFPTPHGVVHVKHRKKMGGEVVTEYEAPEGVRVVVR